MQELNYLKDKIITPGAAPKALSRLSYLVMQEAGHQLFSDTVLG